MRLAFCGCLWLAALGGCGQIISGPRKLVQTPTGGPPVLTTSEQAEAAGQLTRVASPPRLISPVSFEQPVADEPKGLKPLAEWTEQEAAADALGRIGAAAVPELIQALNSPEAAVREKAVGVLGRMGSEAAPAVPSLTRLLDDPDPVVRKAAARTLGRIGPPAKEAVPSLMRTLLEAER